MHGAVSLCEYFIKMIAQRRRSPQHDMVSSLVAAAGDLQNPMSDQEVASACFLLLSAGHETAETLIASMVDLLLRNPEELRKLRATPSLLKEAIEEAVRFEPPLYSQARILTEDMELHGVSLKKGQMVLLSIAAANRDPAVFHEPHRFNITRKDNVHLSFAVGPHHCLGANLARLEASVAIEMLLQRMPNLRLDRETPDYKPPNLMLHQLKSLMVSF
jgi:cytochrome P450